LFSQPIKKISVLFWDHLRSSVASNYLFVFSVDFW
jgi:hypothetical protein